MAYAPPYRAAIAPPKVLRSASLKYKLQQSETTAHPEQPKSRNRMEALLDLCGEADVLWYKADRSLRLLRQARQQARQRTAAMAAAAKVEKPQVHLTVWLCH
eukprot:2415308-Rhodomonas_salina.2